MVDPECMRRRLTLLQDALADLRRYQQTCDPPVRRPTSRRLRGWRQLDAFRQNVPRG